MEALATPGPGLVGVTVGKFNPPHLGHLHLIETAAAQVDHLYVMLGDRPDQTIPAHRRRAWLEDAVPANVTILVTRDDLPPANKPWAERALEVLPDRPDLAFTSEPWGDGWAELMGAAHVPVDLDRTLFPISAEVLRADLGANFHWLIPAARAELARRVVVIGAESTGKTTLAQALANSLGTVWVPEYGRWYWEGRRYLADQRWDTDEFRRIAAAQRSLEADLARRAAHGVVVSDTDALVTAVWHDRYLGFSDPDSEAGLEEARPDLYLLCSPDFEWVQDGTRESNHRRVSMHQAMAERARASGADVVVLTGPPEQRLERALELVRPLTVFPKLI
ncbi:MAG: AAA family ATPase [Acidimicrobiia bacterium]|nr:AAA family ATPase [Acidimicrobiia bacterium]